MKVALLIDAGANQVALSHRVAEVAELVGVVVSRNLTAAARARRAAHPISRVPAYLVNWPFRRAWRRVLDSYAHSYPTLPRCPVATVDEVNDPRTMDFLEQTGAQLVAVSGTNLLRQPLIDFITARGNAINLHTGLAPWVKGGPNCTNWCLANGSFDLIGNTVMWLDAGVDSGAIIASEQTRLTGDESLTALHWKVMEHAHDLYVRVIRALAAQKPTQRVPQESLGEGATFHNADWNTAAMLRARWNHAFRYKASARRAGSPPAIRTVPLSG